MMHSLRPSHFWFVLIFLALLVSSANAPRALLSAAPPAAKRATTPLLFIENVGQAPSQARFSVHGSRGSMYLAENAIYLTLLERPQRQAGTERIQLTPRERRTLKKQPRNGVNLKLSFVGANPQPRLEPFHRLDTEISYLQGDSAAWNANVPVWGGVRYKDLYPGLDLEVTSIRGRWQPRLVVRDNAKLKAVRLRIEGAEKITVQDDHLQLTTALGEFGLPLLRLKGKHTQALLGKPSQPIVKGEIIRAPFSTKKKTPSSESESAVTLAYSTFLGGSFAECDFNCDIAIDSTGAAYVTGTTYSVDFPTTLGSFSRALGSEVFVTKFNATGTDIVYSTYIGGNDYDFGYGIAVDASGAAYVTGATYSPNYPTTPGAVDTFCADCPKGSLKIKFPNLLYFLKTYFEAKHVPFNSSFA